MDNPLISVIVPVYNVEPYLDRCVQSIVDQTYTNLEIILVDDGSPDNCPAMCDAWAEKDSRIKVIHKKNGGAGAARNDGMAIATGDVIAFVDSDDYIAPQMYSHLIKFIAAGADIAECNYLLTEDSTTAFSLSDNSTSYDTETALKLHIEDRIFKQVIWNKLYRRETIENISFPVGKLIDDEFWTYQALGNAKKLVHSDARLYAYRQQNSSVMHTNYSLKWLHAVEAKVARQKFLDLQFPVLASGGRVSLVFTCLYHGQLTLKHLSGPEKKQALAYLKNTLRKHPLTPADYPAHPLTHRVWLHLAQHAFILTCRLRNAAGIGV